MKTSSYALSMLVGISLSAPATKFDGRQPQLPLMAGHASKPTIDNSSKSCFQCIRAGWIWCSSKWAFEEPAITATTADYDAVENGQCCFDSDTAALDETLPAKANVDSCKARFTNASADGSVAENTAGTFWCSNQASFIELALINCRQRKTTCGERDVSISGVVDGTSISAAKRTMTGMTNKEKCTWLIKTTASSPYMKVTTDPINLINSSYDIHYFEIDTPNSYTTFDPKDFVTLSAEKLIQGVHYDKYQYDGQEWPYFIQSTQTKQRYFPSAIVLEQLSSFKKTADAYNTQKTTYETNVKDYNSATENAAVGNVNTSATDLSKGENPWIVLSEFMGWDLRNQTALPPYPWPKPTLPETYGGLEWIDNFDPSTNTDQQKVGHTVQQGGWGSYTLGLLQPTGGMYKTFGTFGQGPQRSESIKKSLYHDTSTAPTQSYMLVSVLPNAWDAPDQGANQFELEIGSYEWTVFTDSNSPWAAITAPTETTVKASSQQAFKIGVSLLGLATASALNYI